MDAGSETTAGRSGVVLVWAISVIGAAIVVALAYSGTDEWFGDGGPLEVFGALGIVLAASVIGALAVQLASRRPAGFVDRAAASVAGAVVVIGVAAAIVAPVSVS